MKYIPYSFLLLVTTLSCFASSKKDALISSNLADNEYRFPVTYLYNSSELEGFIQNTGTATFSIAWSAISTSSSISIISNNCAGRSLNPGQKCTFIARFKPTAAQTYQAVYKATLTGVDEDGVPHSSTTDISFEGTGLAYNEPIGECTRESNGSIINVDNLTVGELIPIVGTNFNLYYSSGYALDFITSYPKIHRGPSFNPEAWTVDIVHYYDRVNQRLFTGNGNSVEKSYANYGDGNDSVVSNGEVYVFDGSGRHLKTRSELTGYEKYKFSYDSSSKLSKITDAFGNETKFLRDSSGRLTTIQSPYGQETQVTTGANGLIATVTNPNNEKYKITYYSNTELMKRFYRPNGQFSEMTYTESGRLASDRDSAGPSWDFSLNLEWSGNQITKKSKMGRTWTYNFNVNEVDNSYSSIETQPSGESDLQKSYSNGGTFFQSYTGSQNREVSDDIRFGSIKKVLARETDFIGRKSNLTTFTYEVTPSSLSNPFSFSTLKTISTKVVDNFRMTQENVYNSSSKILSFKNFNGVITSTTLDSYERPIKSQYANDIPWTYSYDLRGRLSELKQGAKKATNFTYSSNGFLEKIKNARNEETAFQYDLVGRVKKQVFSDGRETSYDYDVNGNLVSITPPGRSRHEFTINIMDLVAQYNAPQIGGNSSSIRYTYNLDKQVTSIQRPDGKALIYNYDSISGLLSNFQSGFAKEEYTYFPNSERIKSVRAISGIKTEYSYAGEIVRSERQADTSGFSSILFERDNELRLLWRVVNADTLLTSSKVNYAYNNIGKIKSIGPMSIAYYSDSARLKSTQLRGIADVRTYDQYGDLESYTSTFNSQAGPSQDLYSYILRRDLTGRIIGKIETILGRTTEFEYLYDSSGRLIEVKKNNSTYSKYVYDANGNRISGVIGGISFFSTFDDQDRILSFRSTSFSYNSNGDLISKQIGVLSKDIYNYDQFGELNEIHLGIGEKVQYKIDSAGRRIFGFLNDEKIYRNIFQSQNQIAMQINEKTKQVKEFFYSSHSSSPDFMRVHDKYYRILKDHLGSPRLVVNAESGVPVQQIEYNEWGKILSNTNVGFQPYGFAGGIYDEKTNLLKFGARDYDPEIGRWTSKDPILFNGGGVNLYGYLNTVGKVPGVETNLYGYSFSDPVNFIDPNGKFAIPVIVGVALGVLYSTDLDTPGAALDELIGVPAAVGSAAAAGPVCKLANSNRYLRIGLGRNGGNKVFRASGQVIEWLERKGVPGIKNGHIDFLDLGPL
ncbi:RHS repeat domain-containing protein [Bdellovibrio sp. BCCA]|uniref:RHS repeat domain-containing protein n=1 Tax=Bdellovibrio sp. BCCA TaxID=3136281 RepID=UPI0030F03766